MEKGKAMWKRGLVVLLTTAMMGAVAPTTILAADVPLLAEFTFDDDVSGFSGGNAKATGTYTLTDSFDAKSGKALYLNGGSTNFLTVTDKNGGSLLTGKEEITISMDLKPDRTDTNWAFYAAPNGNTQTYPNEHYIGVMQSNGTITVERYNNNGSRPSSPSASAGSNWVHVDIVFDKNATTLYIDGLKTSTVSSGYSLPDILGNSSIIQIGKANWVSGEYYKGWIDNFKIYDGALDESDLEKTFDDQMIVDEAYANLDIATKDDVRGNVSMPTEMSIKGTNKKAVITWQSSDDSIVTDMEMNKKAPGIVTRPEKDTEVTVVATITSGDVSRTKEFVLKVKAAPEPLAKTTDYLFAYFTGSEGSVTDEQIYFSTSEDGSQWTDMTANGSPVLFSEIGDKGVRDPYLIRSPEGDKFYMIATDLSIYYRGGWGKAAATTTGSTNLVVWESDNLVDWTQPRLVDVAGSIPSAGCAWAPETFYDENTGNYVVYWATYAPENNVNGDGMNMYYATTRDFYTFSDPVIWIDRSNSIIDTTMIQVGDKYYRASGDGQITIEESDSIYEGWKIIGTLKDIFNNNNYSGAKLEGPEFFKYNEDDYLKDKNGNSIETWGLMCDQYTAGTGYLPFRTTNIADQTTNSWSPASDVNFGSLKKRHGTILPITRDEYNLVMQEIGNFEPEVPVDPSERKVLAQFDFDNDTTGFASENAIAKGSYTLTDSYSAVTGKALYLNGNSTNFLTVTDKNGNSLLTGARQLTISFELKADRTDTNWAFYAAPNGNVQNYPNEHYIGVMHQNGTLTVERYNNNGSRPGSPSAAIGNDWVRVDVVMEGGRTILYVNGEKRSDVASFYKLEDILGNSSILQIGKANWGSGEFYKGWMDNLTILNYALDEKTIAKNAEDFYDALNGIVKELPFEDVKEADWFYEAVYDNYFDKMMTGLTETQFGPFEKLNRAQMATILYRMEGAPEVDYKDIFSDVKEGEWYSDAIIWAQANGIVKGYEGTGLFGPADEITREQITVMMYYYAAMKKQDMDVTADLSRFTDAASVSSYAQTAMKWAVGSGIITGKNEGTALDPQGHTLRAECAQIIYCYKNL